MSAEPQKLDIHVKTTPDALESDSSESHARVDNDIAIGGRARKLSRQTGGRKAGDQESQAEKAKAV
jgi:hypothetical protein